VYEDDISNLENGIFGELDEVRVKINHCKKKC
jgi:hypothetical protein